MLKADANFCGCDDSSMTTHAIPALARVAIRSIGLLSAVLALVAVAPRPASSAETPNVVVIFVDDMRFDGLTYMPIVRERLAAEGVVFENSFDTTPLCCPARASFLTGLYAHNHGVVSNQGPAGGFAAFNDSSTIATWLHDAGYSTGFVGKYLNGYSAVSRYVPPGWDDWRGNAGGFFNYNLNENGKVVNYGSADEDYSTDVFRDLAVSFVSDHADPFFLWLSLYAPHSPSIVAPRHAGQCDTLSIDRPPSYNEADVSDKPEWMQALPLAGAVRLAQMDEEDRRRICSLKAADEAVGAVLDALGDRLDDTLVIFTSDNGLSWGDHRIRGKNCIYESCLRVPLVIRAPSLGTVPGTRTQFSLNIDLAPTIAAAAGVSPPFPVDGSSLLPVLRDAGAALRDDFLVEYSVDLADPSAGLVTAVRNDAWKYVEHPSGERELYDLRTDPFELQNVANEAASQEIISTLQPRLGELRLTGTGAPVITGTPVTGAVVGEPYRYEASAVGKLPMSWRLVEAPDGMAVDASGVVTWTPASGGAFPVTLEVANGVATATQSFAVTVAAPPGITSQPATEVIAGTPYTYAAAATGDQPIQWLLGSGPVGISIDPATGTVSWLARGSGTVSIEISASNAVGTATQRFDLAVTPRVTLRRPVAAGRDLRRAINVTSARLRLVRSSDNKRLQVAGGSAVAFRFRSAVPAGARIQSAVIYVEHHEDPSMTPGAILWRTTLGTLTKPAVFVGSTRPALRTGPAGERVDAWDVSAMVKTPAAANTLKLAIRNQADNAAKTRIDRIYMLITYVE